MITKKSWVEFQKTGLLLIINQILHIFGWAIVFQYDDGKIIDVYPSRVKFRGFDDESTSEAYTKLTDYMKDNIEQLHNEVHEEDKP